MTTVYSKDSFDRFGEDLCVDISSYFPLEDGIKFESLSKQWKRSFYQRVNTFKIIPEKCLIKKFFTKKQIYNNLPAMKSFLKKCPNLIHIEIKGLVHYIDKNEDKIRELLYELIAKNCHNLKSIDDSLYYLTKDLSKIFIELIGPNLNKIVEKWSYFEFSVEPINENLRRLEISGINDSLLKQTIETSFPITCLTHFKIGSDYGVVEDSEEDCVENLRTIIRSNRYLKQLDINCLSLKPKLLKDLLTDLSDLTQLKSLSLSLFVRSDRMLESFRLIAKKCHKLTKLVIDDRYGMDFTLELSYFDLAQYFPKLIHFELKSYYEDVPNGYIQICCPILDKCLDLKHLSLTLSPIFPDFFFGIHIPYYCPKLRHLSIESTITVSIVHFFEGMTDLQTIVVRNTSFARRVADKEVEVLFNRCPRLKSFIWVSKNNLDKFCRNYQGDGGVNRTTEKFN